MSPIIDAGTVNEPSAHGVNALELPSRGLPESPFAFIRLVVRGRYRYWLLALVAGESSNAACGILLPYALNRIITAITISHVERSLVLGTLSAPLALFAALSFGELVLGRVSRDSTARNQLGRFVNRNWWYDPDEPFDLDQAGLRAAALRKRRRTAIERE